jgi:hypothetical protein
VSNGAGKTGLLVAYYTKTNLELAFVVAWRRKGAKGIL